MTAPTLSTLATRDDSPVLGQQPCSLVAGRDRDGNHLVMTGSLVIPILIHAGLDLFMMALGIRLLNDSAAP